MPSSREKQIAWPQEKVIGLKITQKTFGSAVKKLLLILLLFRKPGLSIALKGHDQFIHPEKAIRKPSQVPNLG